MVGDAFFTTVVLQYISAATRALRLLPTEQSCVGTTRLTLRGSLAVVGAPIRPRHATHDQYLQDGTALLKSLTETTKTTKTTKTGAFVKHPLSLLAVGVLRDCHGDKVGCFCCIFCFVFVLDERSATNNGVGRDETPDADEEHHGVRQHEEGLLHLHSQHHSRRSRPHPGKHPYLYKPVAS